jgi:hypothetical protein
MAVHAPGRGELLLPAVQAFHLFKLGKVFKRSAADQAAGRGRGHMVSIGEVRDNSSEGKDNNY